MPPQSTELHGEVFIGKECCVTMGSRKESGTVPLNIPRQGLVVPSHSMCVVEGPWWLLALPHRTER